jgi:hypothetical protein
VLLVQSIGKISVLPAVTPVLLHHCAMYIWTECSVLIQGRGEILLLPAVTAVLLHHNAMVIWTECIVVNTG